MTATLRTRPERLKGRRNLEPPPLRGPARDPTLRRIVPSALRRLAMLLLATATLLGGSGRPHSGHSSDRTSVQRVESRACWAMARASDRGDGFRSSLPSFFGVLPPSMRATIVAPEMGRARFDGAQALAHPPRERTDAVSARGPPTV